MIILPVISVLLHVCHSFTDPSYSPEEGQIIDRLTIAKPYTRSLYHWNSLGTVFTSLNEIRLTPNVKSATGAIWSRQPIGTNAFVLEARLRLSAPSQTFHADGTALWFTENSSLGSAYGISELFTGFGIVLDTYDNGGMNKSPFIGLVASNGTNRYVMHNDGEKHLLDRCRIRSSVVNTGSLSTHETVSLLVEYVPGAISVFYKLLDDVMWQHCFSIDKIFIPAHFFVGVSASTGDLTSIHDIISLKVYELDKVNLQTSVKSGSTMRFEERKQRQARQSSANTWTLRLFFSLMFLIVLFALITMIRPQMFGRSIDSQKRFY